MDIRACTANEEDLRSLRDWLLQESPRPGRVKVVLAPEEPATMGAVADAVQISLGAGGALAVLAGSVSTWLTTRRRHVRLVLERPDGQKLEIDGQVKDPEAVITQFLDRAVIDG